MLRRWPIIEGVAIFAAILVAIEVGRYFNGPEPLVPAVPPVVEIERPKPLADPSSMPRPKDCPDQYVATRTDGRDWVYQCVRITPQEKR